MFAQGESDITAGSPGEPTLQQYRAEDFLVTQRPADEQGVLRISMGGGVKNVDCNYLVFRGDQAACAVLLRQAIRALEVGIPA